MNVKKFNIFCYQKVHLEMPDYELQNNNHPITQSPSSILITAHHIKMESVLSLTESSTEVIRLDFKYYSLYMS